MCWCSPLCGFKRCVLKLKAAELQAREFFHVSQHLYGMHSNISYQDKRFTVHKDHMHNVSCLETDALVFSPARSRCHNTVASGLVLDSLGLLLGFPSTQANCQLFVFLALLGRKMPFVQSEKGEVGHSCRPTEG